MWGDDTAPSARGASRRRPIPPLDLPRSPAHLPHISPTSPLYLHHISLQAEARATLSAAVRLTLPLTPNP